MSFQSWLRQPSTITGMASLLAVAAGVIGQFLTGDTTVATGAGALAFAATQLLVDDNTKAGAVQKLVTDGIGAAVSGHLRDNLPALLRDAVAVVNTGPEQPAAAGETKPAPLAAGPGALLPNVARVGLLVGSLGFLGLLSACSGTTDTQRAAAERSAVSVLTCLSQIAVPVEAEAQSADSDTVKAARAAAIAAATQACRDAAQDGARALPGATPADVPPALPLPATAPAVAPDGAGRVG